MTSPQRPTARSALCTRSRVFSPRVPVSRRPAATLSKIDIVGNGFGFWNTIPISRRTAVMSTSGAYTSSSSSVTLPAAYAPGISSCMRLMHRTIVDLPHPDGPMIAVTSPAGNVMSTPLTACVCP